MSCSMSSESEGSYVLGLVAGLIGGIFVLLFILRRAKPKTRIGLWFGAAVQIILLLVTQLGNHNDRQDAFVKRDATENCAAKFVGAD